jgi:hypothetical protein
MEKIKRTKELLKTLKLYAKLFSGVEERYYQERYRLERMMERETGIKGIEFFFVDGEFVGIGTPGEPKKMRLIHRKELENG